MAEGGEPIAPDEQGTPARRCGLRGRRLRIGFALDVAGYGARSVPDRLAVQRRLGDLVVGVLAECDLQLTEIDHQWTGDGINVLVPGGRDPVAVLPLLIRSTAAALAADNARYGDRIRLRMSIGVGIIQPSVTGFSGPLILHISRLVDCAPLRSALADYPDSDLAVAVSDHLYEMVIRPGYPGIPSGQFRPVQAVEKEFSERAWIWVSARQWSEPAYPALAPGDPREVGGWRIVARLGAGTASRVYLGERTGDGTGPDGRPPQLWAAVKLFSESLAADPDVRRRLEAGALAASVMSEAHLVAVLGYDAQASPPWVAGALVPGPSLSDAVTETGPLPAATVGWLAHGLARTIAGLHYAGFTHGAITPPNVLLDADGPRLSDFGTSRLALASGPRTTPDDVFQFGCTVFYAATGRLPWDDDTAGLAPLADIGGTLGPPDLSGAPPALLAVVRACVDPAPALRPTAAGLAAWLDEVAGERPRPWLPGPVSSRLGEHRNLPLAGRRLRPRTREQ